MRLPWSKPKADQLELLDAEPDLPQAPSVLNAKQHAQSPTPSRSSKTAAHGESANAGRPLLVLLDQLSEDPNNPRTEFPDAEIEELAESIREHGILQPLVVCPTNQPGHYRIHHGAKRSRAARLAGLSEVPVVVRDAPADPYAQVAENQKRHGLTPLDLARLIRAKVSEGESNATIAKRLTMDLTTVAHHLALLDLPPELEDALKSGRCTSPRTLYELSRLHQAQPKQAKALVAGKSEITRTAVAAVCAEHMPAANGVRLKRAAASLLAQANTACARLELALKRIKPAERELGEADLAALRKRVANLSTWSA